ncbi:PAS domain-containing protein, partial [Bradyrhizobium sp.]
MRGVTQPFPDAAARPEDANALGFGAWDLDLATGDFYWSATTRKLFGVGADDPVTFAVFLALLAPEDRAAVEAAIEHSRQQGTGFDMSFKVPGGDHWIRVLAGVV